MRAQAFAALCVVLPAQVASAQLMSDELLITNEVGENVVVWIQCLKHGDWKTKALKAGAPHKRSLHTGKWRIAIKDGNKKFHDVGIIEMSGKPQKLTLEEVAACPECEEDDYEYYKCAKCGRIHKRPRATAPIQGRMFMLSEDVRKPRPDPLFFPR